jgi:nitrate reductase delta subunit
MRTKGRGGHADTALSPSDQAVVWQAAALLLGYPDERLLADLSTVRRLLARVPATVAGPLARVVEHLRTTPLADAQAAYVDTFDSRRRHNLYLTYFAHGDTRKRGIALLRFKQTYLRRGFVMDAENGGELPDHLCVVLEFAATVDAALGRRLLLDHRAGLELLRLSLTESRSPWAGAFEAVSATLPPLRGDEWDAVRRLAAAGPPEEEVGLSPYGGPDFDALLHETTDLPMPSLRTGAP